MAQQQTGDPTLSQNQGPAQLAWQNRPKRMPQFNGGGNAATNPGATPGAPPTPATPTTRLGLEGYGDPNTAQQVQSAYAARDQATAGMGPGMIRSNVNGQVLTETPEQFNARIGRPNDYWKNLPPVDGAGRTSNAPGGSGGSSAPTPTPSNGGPGSFSFVEPRPNFPQAPQPTPQPGANSFSFVEPRPTFQNFLGTAQQSPFAGNTNRS